MFRVLNFSLRNLNKKLLRKNLSIIRRFGGSSGLFKTQKKGFFNFDGFGGGPNPNANNKRYYELLEVQKNATDEEIKKNFRKLAMKHHPDRGGNPDKFKEISRAYEVLSNKDLRQQYDNFGEDAVNSNGAGGQGASPEDIFSNIFGGGFGNKQSNRVEAIVREITVSLEDIYNGITKTIQVNRHRLCKTCKGQGTNKPDGKKQCMGCKGTGMKTVQKQTQMGIFVQQMMCNDCNGKKFMIKEVDKCGGCRGSGINKETKSFQIDIPKGAKNGQVLNMFEEGDEEPGKRAGDLNVVIRISNNTRFVRKGADLYYDLNISLLEALTGFEVELPHFNNKKIVIKSNPNEIIKPGSIKTVKEMGMPFLDESYKHGNLNLNIKIDFPSKLDTSEKEAYEKILKTQKKRSVEKENTSKSYFISEFDPRFENTSERGGKARQEDNEEEQEGGDPRVKCQNQ